MAVPAGRTGLRSGWARSFCFSLSLALFGTIACGEDTLILPEDGEPVTLLIMAGNDQSDTVGRVLRDSLIVRITDPNNRPIKHQPVRFFETPSNTGARTIPDTARTDADGRASARWVLGTIAGPQNIRASVAGPGRELTADFHAEAIVERPDTVRVTSGDPQSGVVGSVLGEQLVVKVTDRYGNPVSGVSASWSAVGGGSVSPTSAVSGPSGEMAVRRTLGAAPGRQLTIATATGLKGSPVTFIHSASVGQPASLIAVSGNGQSGQAGEQLPDPLVIRLVDAMGNGLFGKAVTWPVASGGGTITAASPTTDAAGMASAIWTLGPVPGVNIAIPGSSGFTATFTASSGPTQPTAISANTPIQATGTAGAPASPSPSVRVTDAQGRPVPGVLVSFTVSAGGGSVAPATASTDANGDAAASLWTLGAVAGANALSASATGANGALSGSPVRFTAIAGPGPMSRLAMVVQPSSSGVSGAPLARAPAVQTQDSNGNDVSVTGVVVTATIAGSPAGASLSSASATTDGGGRATFSGLTITGPAATYMLLFTSSPSLTATTSNGISLSSGSALATISILVQPSASVINGAPFPIQPAVLAQDQYGLPLSGVSVSVSVVPSGATLGGQLTRSTDAVGIATFTGLTLTGTVGSYTLKLSVGPLSMITSAIGVTPGPADASRSTASVPSRGNANRTTVITIQTRDQSGNNLTVGGHIVQVTISGKNPVARFTASDNGDGSYTASYTPTRKGNDSIVITLDGTPISGSPYSTTVH